MDPIKTGRLIRSLRQKQGLTQRALAELIGVSDKAISKWERGCGMSDPALLPELSAVLEADADALLRGELPENRMTNGNLKKLRIYSCPSCGNLLFSTDAAAIHCCGRRLRPLTPQAAPPDEQLHAEVSDGEWYITGTHPMTRDHSISFLAFMTGDTFLVRKLYPEWTLETRLPFFAHGTLFWYCTNHGLFRQSL